MRRELCLCQVLPQPQGVLGFANVLSVTPALRTGLENPSDFCDVDFIIMSYH